MEIKRDKYLEKIISYMWDGQVKVITGIRRSGKSYLLGTLFRKYLLENGSYTVQADAVGSAYSTGYFVVKYGDNIKYSVQIPANEALNFKISVADFDGKCSITIEPKWGTSPVGQRDIEKDSVLEVR